MLSCPSCGRPVAVARVTCLYCGAALPRVAPPAAPGGEPPAPAGPARQLVVVDLEGVDAAALGQALGQPAYAAALLARRGGLHLLRVLDGASAEAEAARLRLAGLVVFLVPEGEARARPIRAVGGDRGDGMLALRTEEGPVVVRRGEVLLVVRGPIAREHQPSSRRRRVDTARPEEGYRVHLHRRDEPRPVEIDPGGFEFGFAVTGSVRLELDAWVEHVAGAAPQDDAFRRLPPALGPAEVEPRGALSAVASLSRAGEPGGRDTGPVVHDNLEQFRFYSGWRAAVERRR